MSGDVLCGVFVESSTYVETLKPCCYVGMYSAAGRIWNPKPPLIFQICMRGLLCHEAVIATVQDFDSGVCSIPQDSCSGSSSPRTRMTECYGCFQTQQECIRQGTK